MISSPEEYLIIEGLLLLHLNRLDRDFLGITSLKKGKSFESIDSLVDEDPEVVGSVVKFFLRSSTLFFPDTFP